MFEIKTVLPRAEVHIRTVRDSPTMCKVTGDKYEEYREIIIDAITRAITETWTDTPKQTRH